MNLGTYDINIDFSKLFVHNNTSIYFKEGDLNTAKVRARLTMKNKPINIAGCNVTIRIEPSEGNTITDNATVIDPINGIIEIDLKSNALLEGTHLFEVWIIKDESVKKSGKIGYRVLDSIDDAGAIEGTNEYPILISLISDTNKAIQDAKEVLNIAKDMEANVNEAIGNTNVAISNAETATSNANSKITELDDAKTSMITKVDASIDTMKTDVNKAKEDMKLTTDSKVKEIDTAITNMNASVEDAKTDMQATTDAKMQQVDNSIANMKVETNTAIDNMVSKTDEKITDVNRAIGAGTKDLEVKEAREDANGVVHDTLEQRLKSDLIVGDKSLKDFVIDMNGMKETQDLAYETNTGYKVCNDTQVGVIKDLKLYGKSLVNIKLNYGKLNKSWYEYDESTKTLTNKSPQDSQSWTDVNPVLDNLIIGNKYTLIFDVPKTRTRIQLSTDNGVSTDNIITTMLNTYIVRVFTAKSNSLKLKVFDADNVESKNIKNIMFLNDDLSKDPPPYFEGISSVGNGNKIEASSYASNLLKPMNSGKLIVIPDFSKITFSNEHSFSYTATDWGQGLQVEVAGVIKGETYYIICDERQNGVMRGFDGLHTPNDIYFTNNRCEITATSSGKASIVFKNSVQNGLISFTNIRVVKKGSYEGYNTFRQDKKTVLFKDVDGSWKPILNLRGIDLNNCDTIEKHGDSKHYLHIKTEKETLNGKSTEKWTVSKSDSISTIFGIPTDGNKIGNNFKPSTICDKFTSVGADYQWLNEIESCSVNNNGMLLIRILNSKLSTVDVAGFRKWLQENNVVVIYGVRQEQVYEVNPLDLESFDNMTLWLILSGVIAPPASFKITSSLPNFVKNVDTRVKRMENDFYKYTVTQNRMQLGTTYSSDRTTFRVDTATFSSVKAKQDLDYDLFRLLKHNIIVGPQNYDKAEMENMMDFYVSVGKIDYNMWDELYMLIEAQHNPPVEEETPVI